MTVQEPNLLFQTMLSLVVPFAVYFLGIFIRKVALPGKDSPPLAHQLLLGIPIALVIVSPMIGLLHNTFSTNLPTYFFTLGVIMEHGMLVQETATKHLKERLGK